ncbi:MAG TPA: RluA family pseudouridine synthase [Blastocatellia bacterium]|nr:RluA family pseudouridine synthase [Blastocatellia bacterium]
MPITNQQQTFTFTVETKGLRLDQFLALHFPAVSLTRLRTAIKQGDARLNGRTTFSGWIVQVGDTVTIQLDPDVPTSAMPENIALDVLFEDEDLLIVNKPVGLLSHPSHKEKSGTLLNAIAYHLLHSPNKPTAVPRPILLHRLDRDTSGVIALAKTERANRIVSKAFRERRVKKLYLAVVHGVIVAEHGTIDAPIGYDPHTWPRWGVRENGDASQTNFTVKQRFAYHTLLELEPLTGRTHQLRIHCAHIGHPIVGDPVYRGSDKTVLHPIPGHTLKHQLLHAHTLTLRHPATGEEMHFIAPLPPTMIEAIQLSNA